QLSAQNLALNGSLQVTLTNGFSPGNGSSFVIATNAVRSGSFAALTVPPLQSNLTWRVRYMPDSVILDVGTPPALSNVAFTNGQFQLSLSGFASSAYDIQVSTNLFDWTTIETNSPFPGSINFTDTNAVNF